MKTIRTRRRTVILAAPALVAAILTACVETGTPAAVTPQAQPTPSERGTDNPDASIDRDFDDDRYLKDLVNTRQPTGTIHDTRLHRRAE